MVTSRDVARVAGVSQATVSRVLSQSARVSDATHRRVMEAMRTVGYVPNAAAQTMKTGRTGTVGVVIGDLANPFYPQLLDHLAAAITRGGLRMTVWLTSGAENTAALQAIREGSIDGVLFATAFSDTVELRDALERRSPVVLLNRTLPELECDQVGSDNRRGGELVAEHLLAAGRADTAFIGGAAAASTSAERLAGFSERLAAAGRPLPPGRVSHGEFRHADGYDAMLRLLDSTRPPTSVFCGNDVLAFGALDALRARGGAAPDDVWVVGYDDTDMASWESYSLTSVRQDTGSIADIGVRMLTDRLRDPDRAVERVLLPPRMIERASTGRSRARPA